MKGRVLFVHPSRSIVNPGSGEIEARALLHGFRLAGYKTDVLSFESSSVVDYDLFIFFTCTPEVVSFLRSLPEGSKSIVIPFLDDFCNFPVDELKSIKSTQIYFYSRSREEDSSLTAIFGGQAVISGCQWFIYPFEYLGEEDEPVERHDMDIQLLVMAEPERSQNIKLLLHELDSRATIFSNAELKRWDELLGRDLSLCDIGRRLSHGSSDWYSSLKSSKYLYEPNLRITSSLLEKLWLGGAVILHKENPVLSELKELCLIANFSTNFSVLKVKRPQQLSPFHGDFVAKRMVLNIL
ncbi:hypothetical protein [Pseudomaricurvus sp. HS19]|uniref:hypothetical protein n=1 Tax=Pseudomaricurvus sp. HS19 TaxID=2692626 RepID=UPI00136D405C|nr:hypothetical protein [Pseudomaricurvus sp. HS19]MYM62862.1 hypothetical protein [Pseudomaricurvus sp. HS19]